MTPPEPQKGNPHQRESTQAPSAAAHGANSDAEGGPPSSEPIVLPTGWFGTLLARLAATQVSQPWVYLLLGVVLTLGSVPVAMRLTLNGAFEAMLPDTAPSVIDLNQLIDRFGVASNLSIAVKSKDRKTAFAATRQLAARLEASHDPTLVSIDSGVEDFEKFVEKNKHLYADLDFLKKFQADLHARVEWEAEHESPFSLGLDDDLDVQAPPTIEELRQRLADEAERAQKDLPKYEDGVFSHDELPVAVIFLRTNITSSRIDETAKLVQRIEGQLSEVKKDPRFADVSIALGADLMDVFIETKMLARQMAYSTALTIIAVMAAVYIFFRSFRAVPALTLCLIPPVAATFAVAQLTVGFLNTSTAFLMSIVIGNGINPNVIWLARYFEERLHGKPHRLAVQTTHAATWKATLIASAAAGIAYGSLAVTDFRGFRDFGIIGGVGMGLCWLSAFTILPAIVLASERWFPLKPHRLQALKRNPYGRFFAWFAFSRPKTTVVVGGLLTAASLVAVTLAIRADPIEYDFRNLISERPKDSEVDWVNRIQGEIVNETGTGSAVAILAPSRDKTPEVVRQLEAYGEAHPTVVGPVRSLDSLLPKDQQEKLPVLTELRRDLLRARKFANEADRAELDKNIPPDDLRPLSDADVPTDIRRTFTEKDGTVGRLVYSEHHPAQNAWDGRFWIQWSRAVRSVDIDGRRPPSTGNAMVFTDVLLSLAEEGPIAIAVALGSTVLLLVLSQRSWRNRLLTLSALLGGVFWMAGAMAGLRVKLNFLNFVAFPITFGNGADYGINVIARYSVEEERLRDPRRALREAVERTGGAVVLCSLTTIIGYISLYTSSNKALNSFGIAMAISELTCVATAVLLMPAWMAMRMDMKSPPKAESLPAAADELA